MVPDLRALTKLNVDANALAASWIPNLSFLTLSFDPFASACKWIPFPSRSAFVDPSADTLTLVLVPSLIPWAFLDELALALASLRVEHLVWRAASILALALTCA